MSGPLIEDRTFDELTAGQLHDLLRLRVDVFVVEQQCAYPEIDGLDTVPTSRHVWIAGPNSGPKAYLRIVDDGSTRRIGRVVVTPDARSEGLARALVDYAIATYPGPWELDAQTYLAGWYRRLGFEESGPEFIDYGVPHVPMRQDAAR